MNYFVEHESWLLIASIIIAILIVLINGLQGKVKDVKAERAQADLKSDNKYLISQNDGLRNQLDQVNSLLS